MVTAQPVEPTDVSSTLTSAIFNDHLDVVRPYGSTGASHLQSRFPVSPFVEPGSYGVGQRSSQSDLLEGGPNPSHNASSTVEDLGSTAVGNTPSYRPPFRAHPSPHQGSVPQPPTNPTASQASGTAAASRAATWRRQSSLEEIEAQRSTYISCLISLPCSSRSQYSRRSTGTPYRKRIWERILTSCGNVGRCSSKG